MVRRAGGMVWTWSRRAAEGDLGGEAQPQSPAVRPAGGLLLGQASGKATHIGGRTFGIIKISSLPDNKVRFFLSGLLFPSFLISCHCGFGMIPAGCTKGRAGI